MSSRIRMQDLFKTGELFHSDKFTCDDPFSYLGAGLKTWLNDLLDNLEVDEKPVLNGEISPNAQIVGRVFIEKGAKVEPFAYIEGPCYIGPGSEVRHGAYIRGNVYVGAQCVVGHTTEAKGAIFLDGAKAGHFAYVGDSILGKDVNLGAGTKLANLRFTGDEVSYHCLGEEHARISSGLRKLGALIGDGAQTGCNSVLDPGSILLPRTAVLPCVHFRGTLQHGLAR